LKNIIIFGCMGVGKSTVAKIINDTYGHKIYSLGKKIHLECKLHGKETREEMQAYGQAMRKIFGINIWCDYLENQAFNSFHNSPIAIDDARQLNEFDYFTAKDFVTVGIIANEDIRLDRLRKRVNYVVNKETEQHETEIQARECIDKCNFIIENNGSIDDLYTNTLNKLNKIIMGY